MPDPVIRVDGSFELLHELQSAQQALIRASVRAKKPFSTPNLDRLLIAIYQARTHAAEDAKTVPKG